MAALSAVAAFVCACTIGAHPAFALSSSPSRAVTSPAPASVDFGTVQLPASSDPATVTITNTGTAALTFSRFGIASSSTNPSDFLVVPGGTCVVVSPVAPADSCTVLVRFRPTAAGARSGLLSFWDNSAAVRTNVALGGTATPPADAALSPEAVDFGSAQLATSSDITTVTLSSSGAGTLSFWRFGIATSSANAGDFSIVSGGTCDVSTPLTAGDSCTVDVRFRPTATGARNGILSFWDNTLAARHNVALTGAGTPPAESALDPGAVDFGLVPTGSSSGAVPVTLTNSGAGSLAFWRFGIASSSTNAADFAVVSGGTCMLSTTLAHGESCSVLVRFKPTTEGARSGLLSFWDNTPAGRINATLSGTGLAGPLSALDPGTVDFGSVLVGDASAPTTVTLTNSGAGTLSFWRFGIASSSANAGDFWVVPGGTCAVSVALAAGESCTVIVRFKPTGGGPRSGLLSFWDNTVAGRVDAVLSGNGDDPCAGGCF